MRIGIDPWSAKNLALCSCQTRLGATTAVLQSTSEGTNEYRSVLRRLATFVQFMSWSPRLRREAAGKQTGHPSGLGFRRRGRRPVPRRSAD